MIKLYGFPLSNYFNMVKMALLEKGIDYEFVEVQTSQDESMLARSPMGKVPFIETEAGFLSETSVILEYLDETGGGASLLPEEPMARARVRVLMKQLELYIELPARTCFPEAFFGGTVTDEVKETARVNLAKGVNALKRTAAFSPFVAGSEFTLADIVFKYSFGLAHAAGKRTLGLDLFGDLPAARELSDRLGERDSAKKVAEDQRAG